MKPILPIAAALALAASFASPAQTQGNEHIHLYGKDLSLRTIKCAGMDSLTFGSPSDEGWSSMFIHRPDGSAEEIYLDGIDSVSFRPTAIPEFHITLNDFPEWEELQGKKTDIHPAQLYMLGNGMFDDLDEQTVEFRGRGNFTWTCPKKPYRFKMAKKKSVCGLPKAKSFALIANYTDNTLMRNVLSLWLARYLGMPYTNHTVPVKVYLNGIDKGQYILTEKIGIGSGSVDIDETTGMLFELDSNYDEDYKFFYTWGSKQIPVMVKDPDFDELAADGLLPEGLDPESYLALWQADFSAMADAVTSRKSEESLTDVIDIESVVNYVIVNNFACNQEICHPKSLYIHKKSLGHGEVYHFGPVWDFDWAYTYGGVEGQPFDNTLLMGDGSYNGGSFLKCIFKNKEVMELFRRKTEEFYENGYPELLRFMNDYADLIDPSAVENGNLWPARYFDEWHIMEGSLNFRQNLAKLQAWLDGRRDFILSHPNYGLY